MEAKHQNLIYKDSEHTYEIEGRRLPSVTQVLSLLDNYKFSDDMAMIRGANIHLACEYFDSHNLDPQSIDRDYAGYLEGWAKFQMDFGLFEKQPIVEQPLASQKYWFAGKPDRIYLMEKENLVLDIKTGLKRKVYNLQLEAYRQLVIENYGVIPKMLEVDLKANNTYAYQFYHHSKSTFNDFLCVLRAWDLKNN